MRAILSATLALTLAACAGEPARVAVSPAAPRAVVAQRPPPEEAVRNFAEALARVEPVARAECRARTPPGTSCDFRIVVDLDPRVAPNAFQTLDPTGRPVIGVTLSLIAEVTGPDEIAAVLAHETAHHIAGHLGEARRAAFSRRAAVDALARTGGPARLGVDNGPRRDVKVFELEADRLGTVLTARAGYDPVAAAGLFERLPDPGRRLFATHPSNAERIAAVRETAAALGAAAPGGR